MGVDETKTPIDLHLASNFEDLKKRSASISDVKMRFNSKDRYLYYLFDYL